MTVAGSLAAERMDRLYRHQRAIYDLTRRHYLLGREKLLADLAPPQGGHVLEIACGTAWNLVRAADLYPGTRFYGLDISSAMLATARRSIARRGLQARITLALGDATCFDPDRLFGRPTFDRVIISYALSMLPDWQQGIGAALDAVAERGSLHIVDFGNCDGLPPVFRNLLLAWLAQFSVTPRAGLAAELKRHAAARGMAATVAPIYRGYAISAVLRHSGTWQKAELQPRQ